MHSFINGFASVEPSPLNVLFTSWPYTSILFLWFMNYRGQWSLVKDGLENPIQQEMFKFKCNNNRTCNKGDLMIFICIIGSEKNTKNISQYPNIYIRVDKLLVIVVGLKKTEADLTEFKSCQNLNFLKLVDDFDGFGWWKSYCLLVHFDDWYPGSAPDGHVRGFV